MTIRPRRWLPGALAATVWLGAAMAAIAPGFQPIPLTVEPIDSFGPTDAATGNLIFRGGLALSSPDRRFGSLSGLDFASDGTLYAVSDRGRWFAARPIEHDGRLAGLEEARIAPILNHGGVPLAGKKWGDAEGLRIVRTAEGDTAFVAFEQVNDLRVFVGNDFARVASEPVGLPASLTAIRRNGGLETVAVTRADGPHAGAPIVIAEKSLDAAGNHRAWIVNGPRAGAFSIARDGGFDITDAAALPDGDLLILERGLQLPFGLAVRIRRIAEYDIAPGRVATGPVIFEADLRNPIDNMEGIAVRTGDDGETIIALISDDNNNGLQRTLLLYFALVE
ncbi:esterase-like activity of phytase family protein [Bauldia sp.]|uniref:esterase-like activity of phytase family protein n=1 Tax=Bauldia sp. TaxID=2575872 RepID=UPI003BA8E331